jgi:murein L,D-transpeptidase YcbB/YkuD
LTTRVIVGEPDWPTPQLDGMISRIVVNPYWNVPKSILRKEIIPRMQRDPGYLARENIRVFSGWHAQARELDPAAIDWSGPAAPIYRLRQDPGPQNALGKFKFTFDNSQSIYLHDTQSRRLFNRSARDLSHGCVRVERPFELARLLLEGQGRWNAAALKHVVARGDNHWITLERPIPVHLVYWTAWADEDGRAHFRRDIYNQDWKPYAREVSQQQGT